MSEENKAIARRYVDELWNKGNLDIVDELAAPDFALHSGQYQFRGRDDQKQGATNVRTAFPDFHVTIEDMIAEGDKVVLRRTSKGTHKAEFRGVAPTGKQVTVTDIVIQRIANGMIAEVWQEADWLGLMQQLGAIPSQ